MKKAAIYARVSSKKQKEGETINSQVEAIRQYANKEGYFLPDNWIFLDDGVSGGKLQRPALDELRDMIRVESVDSLLVYAPDRLSRQYSHQLILLEEFKKYGVKICFLKDSPKSDTPEGMMFNHFQGIFAEYERALILDRSRRGRIFKAKQGDPSILASIPYGYKRVKNIHNTSIELVESEAKVVRQIYRFYVYDKMPISQIIKNLAASGVKSPSGLPELDLTTVRNMLKNPSYTGTAYYGKTQLIEAQSSRLRRNSSGKAIKSKYSKKINPEEHWFPINIPQIISENDFELAQEQIIKSKELALRNTKEIALLQGLVTCGKCGYPFYKRTRKYKDKVKGHYYCRSQTDKRLNKCSSGCVDQIELDDLVYKEVIKLLQDPTILQEEVSRRAKEVNNKEGTAREAISLKKEYMVISKERDRLLDAYQSGVLDLKELKKRHQQLDEKRKVIENKLNAIQALQMEAEIDFQGTLKGFLTRIDNTAKDLSLKEKQKLVRLFVEKVVVSSDEIKIVHCIPIGLSRYQNCQLESDAQER